MRYSQARNLDNGQTFKQCANGAERPTALNWYADTERQAKALALKDVCHSKPKSVPDES
jgi:hypothetical protein